MFGVAASAVGDALERFYKGCGRIQHALDEANLVLGLGMEHFATVVFNTCQLHAEVSELRGRVTVPDARVRVMQLAQHANNLTSVLRALVEVGKVMTGQIFFEIGERGKVTLRDWWFCLQNVCIVAARLLSPLTVFHDCHLYNLGKHAQRMSDAMLGLWMFISCIDIMDSLFRLWECVQEAREYTYETFGKPLFTLFNGTVRLASLPFDFGYFRFTPELAIAGTSLVLLANLLDWVGELLDFACIDPVMD